MTEDETDAAAKQNTRDHSITYTALPWNGLEIGVTWTKGERHV